MNHHTWVSKQLLAPLALLLAFAPALKAAKSSSRFHADGKTGSIARVSPSPASADPRSGAQEVAGQTVPRPSPAGAEPPTVKAPQVTYEDGQLTVVAENSSLSDVMKALREALGADIDLPASVVDQHIWVHLGPGPTSRILRDLLDGTEFNYVIQASENDPDGIRSVLLTPRSKSTGAEAGPPERTAIRRMPRVASDAASATDSENPPSEPVAVEPSQAPAPAPPANASSASLQNLPGNAVSSPLTPPTDPNQMIQQLQSMYQQRRQLQMQQNQKAAGQN